MIVKIKITLASDLFDGLAPCAQQDHALDRNRQGSKAVGHCKIAQM